MSTNGIWMCPEKRLPYLDIGGHKRYLAALPDKKVRAHLPLYSDTYPDLDESQWQEFEDDDSYLDILDQDGHGCHSADTEVLTEKGWTRWDQYKWSDAIGTMNPVTGLLEFQRPIAKHVYEYDGLLYRSSNRRIDFAVTPKHRMYVRKWDESKRTLSDSYSFQTADQMGWYLGLPHATTGYVGVDLESLSIGGRSYTGDDFIALVSLVLSDGWSGGTENTKNRVGFCCFRDDRYDFVAELAFRLGFKEQPGRKGVWYKTAPELAEWFRQTCYLGDKFAAPYKRIPDIIRAVSGRQLEHFIKFYGDQDKDNKSGSRRFYSSSRQLIDGLQEILLRVGSRGTISKVKSRISHICERLIAPRDEQYILYEAATENLCIDRKKHLDTERYKGLVYCATVPNSTIVTRYNDKVLISGNSCVGHGAETGFQLAWYQGRGTPHLFSANWIYSLVNGGSDNGAVVGDAMDALIKTGACLDATVPEGNMIFQNQMPPSAMQEASRFKLDTAYRVSTWKSICTAIQLRHPVVFGVDIGRNFAPNKDGFLPQLAGSGGGHCMCARLGMKKLNGQWYIKVQNSWGKDWGKGGICYMPQSYFNGQTDHFVPIAPAVDPQDIHKPPVVHNGLS